MISDSPRLPPNEWLSSSILKFNIFYYVSGELASYSSPMPPFILASTSPRRQELLARLGLAFTSQAPRYEEQPIAGLSPRELAREFAGQKALSLKDCQSGAYILGSDTLLELKGLAIGKPRDAEDAVDILSRLSGKTHHVLTAVALWDPVGQKLHEILETAAVSFRQLGMSEIAEYVATGEPMDKAGAYAIQGGAKNFISELKGDLSTVVGLPLAATAQLLRTAGFDPYKPDTL